MRNPISHRGPEFRQLLSALTEKLRRVFCTKNDLFVFNGSGSAGMQAAVTNLFDEGERVLVITNGFFSERFLAIAKSQRLDVIEARSNWGEPIDLAAIGAILRGNGAKYIKGVLMVHNETSVGVVNPVEMVANIIDGRKDIMLVVDTISSMGAVECPVDRWGADVVITASQKAFMCPAGLAMVSVSPGAWEKHQSFKPRECYFNFAVAKSYLEKSEVFGTPPVPTVAGLNEAVTSILNESLERVWARHRKVAAIIRRGVLALGLDLLPSMAIASDTVTAVKWNKGADSLKKFLALLDTKYNLKLAAGMGHLKDSAFRIGHLGYIFEEDAYEIVERMTAALKEV